MNAPSDAGTDAASGADAAAPAEGATVHGHGERQPIFVGDVQGCDDELAEVIERAAVAFGDDFHLYLVGDLINRGPYNLRALERVRARVEAGRADYVLGNHEIGLLAVAAGLRVPGAGDTAVEVLESREADDWLDWLRRRPVAVVGALHGHPFAMVHASVHPDWSLETLAARARAVEVRLAGADRAASDALVVRPTPGETVDAERDVLGRLTRCRSVRDGEWSSEQPDATSEAWHVAWLRRGHDYGVVYGHWALQGLHVAAGLRGLDTGCVHHGRNGDRALTAWVPVARGAQHGAVFAVPDDAFWSVPARRRYYR